MASVRIFLAGYLGLIALAAMAAESEKKAVDDALSVTKQELETMKNDRFRPDGTAPSLQIPDAIDHPALPTTNGLQTFAGTKKKQEELLRSKGRAQNWLADGVQKNSAHDSRPAIHLREAGDSAHVDGSVDDADAEVNPVTGQPAANTLTMGNVEKNSTRGDRGPRSREAKALKESPPDNPLDRFMGDWMSSKDYALLKKPSDGGPNLRADLPRDEGLFNLGNDSGGLSPLRAGPISSDLGSTFSGVAGGSTSSRENPYLAAPEALSGQSGISPIGLTEPPNFAPVQSPNLLPAYAPPSPSQELRPSSNSPENLKRSEDAKYFPQLKRF